MKKYTSVDEYVADVPGNVRDELKSLRKLIKETAPDAAESISYGMPGYKLNGALVYFAAWKDHISIYPTSSQIEEKIPELAKHRTGKGTLQFPTSKPLPMPLIKKMVELRMEENLAKK